MDWQTTFWQDFTIADKFGIDAVKDTFERAFKEWKSDYIYLTELCIVMNWKTWLHYEHHNQELSKLYSDYYYKTYDYAVSHLKGNEFQYFWNLVD